MFSCAWLELLRPTVDLLLSCSGLKSSIFRKRYHRRQRLAGALPVWMQSICACFLWLHMQPDIYISHFANNRNSYLEAGTWRKFLRQNETLALWWSLSERLRVATVGSSTSKARSRQM
jgi:hypothetical protein